MFHEAEKQNEEIKRLKWENERERAERNCLSKKWLKLAYAEKVKEKHLKKTR